MGYISGERWQARHKGGLLVPSLSVSQYIMQFVAYLTNSASRNDPKLAHPEKEELIWWASTVLHPYYKLDYIKLAWGSEKEQADEREAGNWDAKNWQDKNFRENGTWD